MFGSNSIILLDITTKNTFILYIFTAKTNNAMAMPDRITNFILDGMGNTYVKLYNTFDYIDNI